MAADAAAVPSRPGGTVTPSSHASSVRALARTALVTCLAVWAMILAGSAVRTLAAADGGGAGGRWRLLGFTGGGAAAAADRPPRTYVVLGVDLDTEDFAALAPLTAYIWARSFRAGVTPLVLATGANLSALRPSSAYILAALAEAGARVELFPVPAAHHPVSGAQVARLLAYALPGIAPHDVLLTSDVDLWPLSRPFWERALNTAAATGAQSSGGPSLWVYNGLWTWKQIIRGGGSAGAAATPAAATGGGNPHLAMSVLGATARTWCELSLHVLTLHGGYRRRGRRRRGRGAASGGGGSAGRPVVDAGEDGVDDPGLPGWSAAVGAHLSALFSPDLHWDDDDPPTCVWRPRDGALRLRFPRAPPPAAVGGAGRARRLARQGYQGSDDMLDAAAAAAAAAGGGGGGRSLARGPGRPPAAADDTRLGAAPSDVVIVPTLGSLVGAALEAGRLSTGGASWARGMPLADFKKARGANRAWYWDQLAISAAERRMGLCPSAADVGQSAALWPRCVLNRDLRRLDRNTWEDQLAGGSGSTGSGAVGASTFTDAHVHPAWVLESPHHLLRPWRWADPQAPIGAPFFHRYMAGLAALRRAEGLRGPPVPVAEPRVPRQPPVAAAAAPAAPRSGGAPSAPLLPPAVKVRPAAPAPPAAVAVPVVPRPAAAPATGEEDGEA
jgi:hypothetical protein